MEYAPEWELFDLVVKESEKETSMNKDDCELNIWCDPIVMVYAPDGKLFDQVMRESEKETKSKF